MNSKKLSCEICDCITFSTMSNKKRHYLKIHNINYNHQSKTALLKIIRHQKRKQLATSNRKYLNKTISRVAETIEIAEETTNTARKRTKINTNTAKCHCKRALEGDSTRGQVLQTAKETSKRELSDEKQESERKRTTQSSSDSKLQSRSKRKPDDGHDASLVNVGFVPDDISNNPLSAEQMSKLQEAVIDTVIEKGGNVRPEFEGCSERTGWLMVTCSNRNTVEWLKVNVSAIVKKCNFHVTIVEESAFPSSDYVLGYVPQIGQLRNKKIYKNIGSQNNQNECVWRVTVRKKGGPFIRVIIPVHANSWSKVASRLTRLKPSLLHLCEMDVTEGSVQDASSLQHKISRKN